MDMKRKTKNKNKINKKRGWQKINREKRKRALAHRIGVTKVKLLKEKKTKLMIGKNKKHHKKGINGRESNFSFGPAARLTQVACSLHLYFLGCGACKLIGGPFLM